jgi:hypothetical protein
MAPAKSTQSGRRSKEVIKMCGGNPAPYIPKNNVWEDVLNKLIKTNSHIFIELVRGCNNPCPFKCYGSLRTEEINITPDIHNDIIVPLFRRSPFYYPNLKIVYYGYGETTNYPFEQLHNLHNCQINLRGDIHLHSPILKLLASPIRSNHINLLANLYSTEMAKNINSIQASFDTIATSWLGHVKYFFDAVQIPVLKGFDYINIAKHVVGIPIIFRGIAKDSPNYIEAREFLKDIKDSFGTDLKIEQIKNIRNNNLVLEGVTIGGIAGYVQQENITLVFRRCIKNNSERFELKFDNIQDMERFTKKSDSRCTDFSIFLNSTRTTCDECYPSWKAVL